MTASDNTTPENDVCILQLRDHNGTVLREIDTFREYSFNNHFIVPTDGFSFTIGDEVLRTSIRRDMFIGQRVTLMVNGYKQADGFIEHMKVISSRSGGTELVVEGRDRLAPAVTAHMDPLKVQFTQSQSLEDLIIGVFSQFGWDGLGQIEVNNDDNVGIATGVLRGTPTSKKGKPLKSFQLHALKPYLHEGCFAFASRVAQRYGLWIWPSADGDTLIVSKPDFTQKPIYRIVHKTGVNGDSTAGNNVLNADVSVRADNQPSIIVATGFGGGGEYTRSSLMVAMVNELTGLDDNGAVRPEVAKVLDDNPTAVVLPLRPEVGGKLRMPFAQHAPMFLHDDESKTLEQLENFVRREMALKQHQAFSASYTFEKHTLGGTTWFVDAMADVDDDIQDIHTSLYVMSRTFEKSRNGGTKTHVDLILPNTLLF